MATPKLETFDGRRLLLVDVATVDDSEIKLTGQQTVCVDTVGAGEGDLVMAVMGNSSRIAPDMNDVPTDAVIVGIIDSLHVQGLALTVQ